MSKHFSQPSHCGIDDVEISILEFIKTSPRSPQVTLNRNRVEKHCTHLLRCMALLGLNIETQKEYTIKTNYHFVLLLHGLLVNNGPHLSPSCYLPIITAISTLTKFNGVWYSPLPSTYREAKFDIICFVQLGC